jgi:hypothetical protein
LKIEAVERSPSLSHSRLQHEFIAGANQLERLVRGALLALGIETGEPTDVNLPVWGSIFSIFTRIFCPSCSTSLG